MGMNASSSICIVSEQISECLDLKLADGFRTWIGFWHEKV